MSIHHSKKSSFFFLPGLEDSLVSDEVGRSVGRLSELDPLHLSDLGA